MGKEKGAERERELWQMREQMRRAEEEGRRRCKLAGGHEFPETSRVYAECLLCGIPTDPKYASDYMKAKRERDEARQLALALFEQACAGADGKYDHQYVSTYEAAQAELIGWGLVKAEDCKYAPTASDTVEDR
jgi:hypothetical protein